MKHGEHLSDSDVAQYGGDRFALYAPTPGGRIRVACAHEGCRCCREHLETAPHVGSGVAAIECSCECHRAYNEMRVRVMSIRRRAL